MSTSPLQSRDVARHGLLAIRLVSLLLMTGALTLGCGSGDGPTTPENLEPVPDSTWAVSERVWLVRGDGSGEAPDLQAAIDSAAEGDTVLLAIGSHVGSVTIDRKGLTLIGEGGPSQTGLHPPSRPYYGPAIRGTLNEGQVLRVQRLRIEEFVTLGSDGAALNVGGDGVLDLRECTISNNLAQKITYSGAARGGALHVGSGIHLVAKDCEFVGNYGMGAIHSHDDDRGGAMYAHCRSVLLQRCAFRNNSAFGDGGGGQGGAVSLGGPSLVVEDCEFTGNFAAFGAAIHSVGTLTLAGSLFSGNKDTGGSRYRQNDPSGLVEHRGELTIRDCAFVNNLLHESAILVPAGTRATIVGVTVAFNRVDRDATPVAIDVSANASGRIEIRETLVAANDCGGLRFGPLDASGVQCNILWGNAPDIVGGVDILGRQNNLSVDPRFCSTDRSSIAVDFDSPCLPGQPGHATVCGTIGSVPSGCAD
jgi:hypothetical protein